MRADKRSFGSVLRCVVPALLLTLAGCGTMPGWISSSGASREQVMNAPEGSGERARIQGIALIDVSDAVARNLARGKALGKFSDVFPRGVPNNYVIGAGDVIEVSVWESPPAMLFNNAAPMDPSKPVPATTNAVTFPAQMVSNLGTITVPFAGRVSVQGRTSQQIEDTVAARLAGKANSPQVLVRVVKNNSASVTVVGEVTSNLQMPLTPKGEHLLDAIAAGGGVKQPVSRVAIQLTRGAVTSTMALDSIIRDPRQNLLLQPGDVVTALFQPLSFSVLGATGKNDELPLEAQGISLAQALARAGGLADNRADARGVFIFRFEDPKLLAGKDAGTVLPSGVNGTVPVVYQVDLRDPSSFFVVQNFPIQNGDVIYVANSPEAEFNKFLRLVVSVAVPTVTLDRTFQ
ncbi:MULTISPECIES: polysaccharide biosynthesis/export family protein [unclassified Achromobacter]|uniref:polysaccharide biosynthesis/export family protein n=1 Tax=unclassified Achromobacter TaxID=2626865 RepID=UPI0018E91050|nr:MULTISPECIES: polysaccharide biosynthesis/export family protein [unclassified Achromobacter]